MSDAANLISVGSLRIRPVLYGEVVLRYQNGKVTLVERKEQIRPEAEGE